MLISSDAHMSPYGLTPQIKKLFELAYFSGEDIVLLGDTFEFMEFHWKEFVHSAAVNEWNRWLYTKNPATGKAIEIIVVEGNHDPKQFIEKIGLGNSKIYSKVVEFLPNGLIHMSHGHEFSDWSLWDNLSNITANIVPWIWQPLQKLRRITTTLKPNGETVPYSQYVGMIHTNGIKYAEKYKLVVIMGHCHKPWIAGPDESNIIFYDVGDLITHNTYLRIDKEGNITMNTLVMD